MTDKLDAGATRHMMLAVSQSLIDQTDVLTDADLTIGDGDHGVGMRRGFEAALEALNGARAGKRGSGIQSGWHGDPVQHRRCGGCCLRDVVSFRIESLCYLGVVDDASFAASWKGLAAVLNVAASSRARRQWSTLSRRRRAQPAPRSARAGDYDCSCDARRARRRRGQQGHDRNDRQGAVAWRAQYRSSRPGRDLDLAHSQGDAGLHRKSLKIWNSRKGLRHG